MGFDCETRLAATSLQVGPIRSALHRVWPSCMPHRTAPHGLQALLQCRSLSVASLQRNLGSQQCWHHNNDSEQWCRGHTGVPFVTCSSMLAGQQSLARLMTSDRQGLLQDRAVVSGMAVDGDRHRRRLHTSSPRPSQLIRSEVRTVHDASHCMECSWTCNSRFGRLACAGSRPRTARRGPRRHWLERRRLDGRGAEHPSRLPGGGSRHHAQVQGAVPAAVPPARQAAAVHGEGTA